MKSRKIPRAIYYLLLPLVVLFVGSLLTQAQTVITTIPVGSSPQGVAVNPTTNHIYVTNVANDSVSVIDGTSSTVVATIHLTPTIAPVAVATNPTTNRIYVANGLGSSVSVIDGTSNAIIATVGVGVKPSGVAVNPTTNRIYVTNRETGNVSVINGTSNAVIATISLGLAGPLDVAVNPSTNRIYVANSGSNNVSVIDGTSNAIIATIPIGNLPVGVAVNPGTNRIYVANTGMSANNVSVIDGSTNAVIATVPVGVNPRGIAVNTATNHIYVANQDSNNVSVIDGNSNAVLTSVAAGTTPYGMAANPTTNRFYVTNNGSNNASVIQDSPSPTATPTHSPVVTQTPTPVPTQVPTTTPAVSTWFFAEGSTQPPFDTWFLVENPGSQVASVTFTFFLQPSGTVVQTYVVGPTSRFSLYANQAIPNVAFSTRIDSNVPVFAERAMYVGYDGDVVTGIPAANTTWLFAEGATVQPFHTWLLLQNPNNTATAATITYLLDNGQTVSQNLILPANSRTSVFVNQVLPNAAFSSQVHSDLPIIAERAMYRFPGNAAMVNSGVNAPSLNWFFAEGRTSFQGTGADTFLLLQNPNATQATATITLYGTDGRVFNFSVGILPTSRLTVYLNPVFSGSFGIKVTADIPIIAERSVFFGNEPRGAYSAQGATALATAWHLAEGQTLAPFDEIITILNPQGTTMSVHINFLLENGQVIGRDFTVGANSKLEIQVDNFLAGANSASITTSLPSVVERTMFIFKQGRIGAHDTIGFAGG